MSIKNVYNEDKKYRFNYVKKIAIKQNSSLDKDFQRACLCIFWG